MAGTVFANMQVVPDKFTSYVNERTTKKSALVRSGITAPDERVAALINGTPQGGNTIVMPFYKPLTGDDDIFGEDPMTATGIATANQKAALLIRQHAWSSTDLAKVKGGSDPMAAIMDMVSDWWIDKEQAIFVSELKGLFGTSGALADTHLLDVSAKETGNVISVENTLDAKQLMGDAADKLGLVCVNSAVYTKLQKNQDIETVYDSDLKIKIDTYLGYQVIVDDDIPASGGVYDTYFIGKGAFARQDGMPAGLIGTETDRDKLASVDYLINRRAFVLTPNGVSFEGTPAKAYASNAELATPANWKAVAETKNIPIVCLRHKI